MNLTISGQFERTMVQGIGKQQDTNKLRIRDICLYKCLDVRLSFLYFDPRIFVSSDVNPVPNFTKQNPLVYRSLPVSS